MVRNVIFTNTGLLVLVSGTESDLDVLLDRFVEFSNIEFADPRLRGSIIKS
jgi:hypothetical protein